MSGIHWKNDLITNFDTAADWTGDTDPSIGSDAIPSMSASVWKRPRTGLTSSKPGVKS